MSEDSEHDVSSDRFLEPTTPEAEAQWAIELVGTINWDLGARYKPEALAQELPKLPALRRSIRHQADVAANPASTIALIDWTSLDNTCRLLAGDDIDDPFVALLDFATILGAILFYDRLLVLDITGDTAAKANKLLMLDEVIRPINRASTSAIVGDRWSVMLDSIFASALRDMINFQYDAPNWLDELAALWHALVPAARPLNYRGFDTHLSYSASPRRHSGSRMIFCHDHIRFLPRDAESLRTTILDNDVRALFYEKLAHVLSVILRTDHEGPPVHYIGGCLRTPMKMIRAHIAEKMLDSRIRTEDWLKSQWHALYQKRDFPVRMPFWFDAILARTKGPLDIPEAVRSLRDDAHALRSRRGEMETMLARGNASQMEELTRALAGDIGQFTSRATTTTGAVVKIAEVAMKTAVPVFPAETAHAALKAGSELGAGWLRETAVRLFRPQIWSVYRMGQSAREVQRSLEVAFTLFDLPRADADIPKQFLSSFAALSWIQ
ncbi:MAG: hypothetical protein IPK82_20535 [Polyangiaceae bacterium]|nr:hypothetical protein [Polyangiaceae bacterium]